MKNVIRFVILFLSLGLFGQVVLANGQELENAISKLWLNGPDKKIEETLSSFSRNEDTKLAEKATFHLICLRLLQGNEPDTEKLLSQLKRSARSKEQKKFVNKLNLLLKPEIKDIPEGMSKNVSIDFKNMDINDALKTIAKKADLNIAIHRKIVGKIELKLTDVTAKQAFDSICKSYELDYRFLDGILTFVPQGLVPTMSSNYSGPLPDGFQKKISLDFRDTDVRAILKLIAAQSGANIVIHKRVRCRANISLTDATIEQALNSLCASTDLRYENNDGIFVVMPAQAERRIYSRKEVPLSYLAPNAAVKMLLSTVGQNKDIMIKPLQKSVMLEGSPYEIEKLETFLRVQDKQGKAQKISFKIWQIKENQNLNLADFQRKNETQRKEIARIIAAPALIALPGNESKIEVGSRSQEDNSSDNEKESFSYSFSCIFHETEKPEIFRLISSVRVKGISFSNGEKHEIKKEFAPTLEVKRNEWAMIPLIEEKEKLFLELQISNYLQ
jgi:type II secretory pathway component GspD/PulD (secretin)